MNENSEKPKPTEDNNSELDLNMGIIQLELKERGSLAISEELLSANESTLNIPPITNDDELNEMVLSEHSEGSILTNSENSEICFFKGDYIGRDVTKKVLSTASSIGNFLYSVAYSASTQILEGGILGEFHKEQTNFINDQIKPLASTQPPWVGYRNEDLLKEQCLNLSSDRRYFLRSPPAGNDFKFDYSVCYPIAESIMREDTRLEQLRYELVPKFISEKHFWRNYFYRVGLIFQANEAETISSSEEEHNADQRKEDLWMNGLEFLLEDYELINESIS